MEKDKLVVSSVCLIGACVGVAYNGEKETVSVQRSDNQTKQLTFSRAEWTAFVAGVKKGEFDLPR